MKDDECAVGCVCVGGGWGDLTRDVRSLALGLTTLFGLNDHNMLMNLAI